MDTRKWFKFQRTEYLTGKVDYRYFLCRCLAEAKYFAHLWDADDCEGDITLAGYATKQELAEEVGDYHEQMDPVEIYDAQDSRRFVMYPMLRNLRFKLESWIFKLLLVLAFLSPIFATRVEGHTKQQSPWSEIQVVDIPYGLPVYQGVTKNGNPKYWFDFKGLQVTVSAGNAAKYKAKEVTLVLVKWQHKDTGNYKYSTRQKDKPKSEPVNIDITTLF